MVTTNADTDEQSDKKKKVIFVLSKDFGVTHSQQQHPKCDPVGCRDSKHGALAQCERALKAAVQKE